MSVRPIARSLAVQRTLTKDEVAKVSGADNMIELGDSTLCSDPNSFTRPDPNTSIPDQNSMRDSS